MNLKKLLRGHHGGREGGVSAIVGTTSATVAAVETSTPAGVVHFTDSTTAESLRSANTEKGCRATYPLTARKRVELNSTTGWLLALPTAVTVHSVELSSHRWFPKASSKRNMATGATAAMELTSTDGSPASCRCCVPLCTFEE